MDYGITDNRTRLGRRHRRCRGILPVAVSGLALIALLTGCGSSGQRTDTITSSFTPPPLTSSSPDSSSNSPDPDSQEGSGASTEPAGGGITQIGTMTQTWTGASTTATYSVGTPTFGDSSPLPDGVASACQLTDPAVLDSAAYFPLTLAVSFTGQVTTDVLVAPDGALENGATPLRVGGAYIASADAGTNQWSCDDSALTYSLAPGDHLTITSWIIVPGEVTNQDPHPSIDNFNTWSFAPPVNILMAGDSTSRPGGPHAAICNDGGQHLPVLSLFIAPPYRYGGQDGLTVQCSPA